MFIGKFLTMIRGFCILFFQLLFILNFAQYPGYWQQAADYTMEIDIDEKKFQYDGKMKLVYTNNSPDDLEKVYLHLYYNAFQPGSAMDHRLRNIADPDSRMVTKGADGKPKSRIAELSPEDIGFHKIHHIRQNGKDLTFDVSGTIMTVHLAEVLKSGQQAVFEMEWKAQIPQIIRRGGKHTTEGIDFSMTQWYPKMAHYDHFGWHLDEYIGREFAAPFADFDVKINIHKDYIIGSSGKLQNPNEVKGYVKGAKQKVNKNKTTWHFKADQILDFAWGADKDYVVSKREMNNGPTLYFLRKNDDKIKENWEKAEGITMQFFDFMNQTFGQYPWETYSIIQGGDGGMEYGTSTLITGNRNLESLVGVIFHEVAHSWFQQMFAINETVHEWMDEGFTSYAHQLGDLFIQGKTIEPNPNLDAYGSYFQLVEAGIEEPMSLLADYYDYNYAYSIQAYVKGQVYLIQLGYIIGDENLKNTFKEFYNIWKFKHPQPNDFTRIAEKVSGLNLKWYDNLFINTTRSIDYSVQSVTDQAIHLENLSNFPMPIDLFVEYEDGSRELFYIPNLELRGEKEFENLEIYQGIKRTTLEPWAWTNPNYTVEVSKKVKKVIIDPTQRLADRNYSNNIFVR